MRNADPYISMVLGNYQIKSLIACGTFGCVYLAQHLWLPRVVAIKLLRNVFLHSPQEQKRFRQEARILEKLRHPHIVKIYDFGISDLDFPYLVIEYAPNGSLYKFLQDQNLAHLQMADALSILSQMGNALHYANQHGILHHDLKPANILFNSKNEVLLTDFGIAIVRVNTTVNHPAASTGTPLYMAPEQFLGRVGPKSDQYSLGCIAYELVTGQPPFLAPNTAALSYLHLYEKPIPPKQLNPAVPQYVEDAILKALEKESNNRHKDVAAFVAALNDPYPQVHSQVEPKIYRTVVKQHLEEVYRLTELECYEEALAICNQTLLLNPYYVETYKAKAFLLIRLKHYEEALAVSIQIIKIAPGDGEAWKHKGETLYILRRYKEALAAYARASQFNPGDPAIFHKISKILKILGWLREAQLAYTKACQPGFKSNEAVK